MMKHLQQAQGDSIATTPKFNIPPRMRKSAASQVRETQYKPGAYSRLSRDDGRHKAVSASIETQKDMINRYAQDEGLDIYGYYVDDGYTGTNFKRPSWQRMMADIEGGKINIQLA